MFERITSKRWIKSLFNKDILSTLILVWFFLAQSALMYAWFTALVDVPNEAIYYLRNPAFRFSYATGIKSAIAVLQAATCLLIARYILIRKITITSKELVTAIKKIKEDLD